MTTPARISLCLIVRNEAEMLPRFIAAAQGCWDELCVVDTGSTDGTVGLIEAAGGHVTRRPWDDDFAAARNASLDMATGDWILQLDPDEMLSTGLSAQIRAVADDRTAGAATLLMRNAMPGGHVREARLLRMFRADPRVRYEFPIHEDVSRTLGIYLTASGRRIVHLSGAVEHLGYVRSHAAARGKRERDGRILQACVDRDPSDLYSWFKLLELARFWKDQALLTRTAPRACAALDRAGVGALSKSHFGGDLIALLAAGLFAAEVAAARAFIDAWASRVPASAVLFMRQGELSEALGDGPRAADSFTRCLPLADVTPDVQFATVRPLLGLARLAMARGDLVEAWRLTQEALGHNPRDREALLGALFISRLARGAPGIDDFVQAYANAYGDSEEMRAAVQEINGPVAAVP